jgi:hypothetical protein
MITVRRDQVASVMQQLVANRRFPTMLFMLNNPTGWTNLVHASGQDRVLLGFPGVAGPEMETSRVTR